MCISNSYLFDCICDPNISHSVRIKSNQTILIMHDEQEIFMLQTNTTCIHLFFSPPFPQMTSKIIINNPSRSIPHENIILSEQKKKKREMKQLGRPCGRCISRTYQQTNIKQSSIRIPRATKRVGRHCEINPENNERL